MSRGNELQEMEVGTKQSKTAVNAGAKPAEGMDTSIAGPYEDLRRGARVALRELVPGADAAGARA